MKAVRLQKILFIGIVAVIAISGKLSYDIVTKGYDSVKKVSELSDNVSTQDALDCSGDKVKVHGNSHENMSLHIVYEIFAVDSWSTKHTLKFGLTSQKDYKQKEGNPRPQKQLREIANETRFENFDITDRILYRNIEGRVAAKAIEQTLITDYYYYLHGEVNPPLQLLPLPDLELY